jgi:hypothetical protein
MGHQVIWWPLVFDRGGICKAGNITKFPVTISGYALYWGKVCGQNEHKCVP